MSLLLIRIVSCGWMVVERHASKRQAELHAASWRPADGSSFGPANRGCAFAAGLADAHLRHASAAAVLFGGIVAVVRERSPRTLQMLTCRASAATAPQELDHANSLCRSLHDVLDGDGG